jgi:hypothetical protein
MRIPLSRSVVLSMITHLLYSKALGILRLISIALGCTSINACTYVNGYISTSMMFSSLASVYIACASTYCYSFVSTYFACASIDYCYVAFSSFDYLMNIESTNVTPSPSCSFARQLFQRLCKNSIVDVQSSIYIMN